MDIKGKLTTLHGLPACYLASRPDPSLPVLGLLAVCTPFVPPPSLDGPDTQPFLKTKHSLDFALFSVDGKAKLLLELEDKELPVSFYTLVHHQDVTCLAEAHKEAIKSGASGLLVYRVIARHSRRVYWLQSSCRLFYKNGKPESVGCTHRLLTEVEGETLLEKRASLSAKILSFDDSLLQSPKLLQSTAALTAPAPPAPPPAPAKLGKAKRTKTTAAPPVALRGSSINTIRTAAAALAATFPTSPSTAPLPPYLPQVGSYTVSALLLFINRFPMPYFSHLQLEAGEVAWPRPGGSDPNPTSAWLPTTAKVSTSLACDDQRRALI